MKGEKMMNVIGCIIGYLYFKRFEYKNKKR
jgi:hypothetical protein